MECNLGWNHTRDFKIERARSASSILNHKYDFTPKLHDPKFNRPCSIYQYILTWLRGFQVKLLNLVLFSLFLSLFWELRDKRTAWKFCNFDPKASEPSLNIDISNVAYYHFIRSILKSHNLIAQIQELQDFGQYQYLLNYQTRAFFVSFFCNVIG